MAQSVLVAGGGGYFGSVLVEHCRAAGDRVRILDIAPAEEVPPGVEYVRGDIRDPAAAQGACDGVEIVYHAVAQVPLARNRRLIDSVNVGGTEVLLAAARSAGVAKVVYISSSAVFGIPAHNPVTEASPLRPLEAYGRAKLRGEQSCHEAVRAGLDTTVVRPRTILGLGRLGIMSVLFDWVADGRSVYVVGHGDNRYQFIHATDLADACLRAAQRAGPSVYNVGAAEFGTMRETLQALVDHAGTGAHVRSLPIRPALAGMRALAWLRLAPLAPYHWLLYGQSLYFDITRARTELGWSPRYSNAAALTESYDWFCAHRRELRPGGASHHLSPVRQGALRVLKWLS